MLYAIEVLGLSEFEYIADDYLITDSGKVSLYGKGNYVKVETQHVQLGIINIEAFTEIEAMIKTIKICVKYYDIFKQNYSKQLDVFTLNSITSTNHSHKITKLQEIPSWLFEYFKKEFIMGYRADIQSLEFKLLK